MPKNRFFPRRRNRPSPGARWLSALAVLCLGAFGWAGFHALSPAPGIPSPLTSHVALRYAERGPLETGGSHPTLAVFADYRALDPAVTALVFMAAAFVLFLPGPDPKGRKSAIDWPGLWVFAGPCLAWGLGLACLAGGANFLDYDGLRLPLPSGDIRAAGAALVGAGLLLAALFLTLPRAFGQGRKP
ncbi:MAG TPA: hypothetical protein VFR02_07045 [bacterium]|nr:hypothetical protein [bacterium]